MNPHLIFFDNRCKLCQNAVQRLQKRDTQGLFSFFPLTSQKAKDLLPEKLLKGDTMVLVESGGKIWVRARAVFRILYLLDLCADRPRRVLWKCLSWLPGSDLLYRAVAHSRRLFK
jgi:predicted DCC family thiol-disulfide oxidoreductase YuxK